LRIVRIGERRQIWERAFLHVAFRAVCRADLHITFYARSDLDCFAALEFGRHVKTVERIVNPNSILIRIALHGGAIARECGRSGRGTYKEEEDSETVIHVVSRMIASGVRGTSGSGVVNDACPEPKVYVPSL
jgi:hypothetical protein